MSWRGTASGPGLRAVAPRPTRRGLGVLAVLAGLVALTLATDTSELVPLAVGIGLPLVLAPLAASWKARRARRGVAVAALTSPPMGPVGGEISLQIRVTNRTSRPMPALSMASPARRWRPWRGDAGMVVGPSSVTRPVVTRAPGGLPAGLVVPAGLVTLAGPDPLSTEVQTSPVPTGRRGVFILPPSPSWVLDAFGLFGAAGPTIPIVTVVLHPESGGQAAWPPRTGNESGHGSTMAVPGGDGPGELVGIRPYVAGDRLSLLHWPARARYGSWFVRQFAPELAPQSSLILDDRAGVHRQADFELMLSAAQGLIEGCRQSGRTIELRTLSGRSTRLPPLPLAFEGAEVFLATLLPRATAVEFTASVGTVLTTTTGARTLPDVVDRIVVAR